MNTLLNNQKVVAHPETGEVITLFTKVDSHGEEKVYGKIRVDDIVLTMNNNFVMQQRRTAFITLAEEAIQVLAPYIKEGKPYPMEGKIIVKESLEPFYEGQTPKVNPSTDEYILVGGQHVYRTTEFTTNLEAKDELLQEVDSSDLEQQVIREELVM